MELWKSSAHGTTVSFEFFKSRQAEYRVFKIQSRFCSHLLFRMIA